MAVRLADYAHYGRYYPSEGFEDARWWFDLERETPIYIDDLIQAVGSRSADALREAGYAPFFQLDVEALGRAYAESRFFSADRRALFALDGKAFDIEFRKAIDRLQMTRD